MTSTGVNALRWGALVFGVFYGFSHQASITSNDKKAAAQHEYDRKAKLIDDAKTAYTKRNDPKPAEDPAISDPDSPNFDLEKYLTKVSEESP